MHLKKRQDAVGVKRRSPCPPPAQWAAAFAGGSAELPGAVSDGPDACEPSGGPGRQVGLGRQHVDLLVPPGLGHCCPCCASGASILLGAAAGVEAFGLAARRYRRRA